MFQLPCPKHSGLKEISSMAISASAPLAPLMAVSWR